MSTKKKQVVLRLPEELHAQAAAAAAETHIPFNSFVLQAISEKLKRSDWLDPRSEDDGK